MTETNQPESGVWWVTRPKDSILDIDWLHFRLVVGGNVLCVLPVTHFASCILEPGDGPIKVRLTMERVE